MITTVAAHSRVLIRPIIFRMIPSVVVQGAKHPTFARSALSSWGAGGSPLVLGNRSEQASTRIGLFRMLKR